MPRVVREELHVSDIESDSDDELEQELAKLRKALAPREVQTRPATVRPSPATAVDAGPSPQPESGEEPERHHPNHARLQDRLDHLLVQRDGMQAALDANRALQTQLELVKDQLDKFVLDNEQQVASIQQLRVNPSAGKGENPDGLARSAIGPSRFWVKGDRVPDYNDDAVALLPYFSHLPHRFQHPPQWNAQDCSKLQKQVLMIVQSEKGARAVERMQGKGGDLPALFAAVNLLKLSSSGVGQTIKSWSDDFWQQHISPCNGRSGVANRIHWFNCCSPDINKDTWSEEEVSDLHEIVHQHNKCNWEKIAKKLGTRRCAMDCMVQFKKTDQPDTGHGPFSAEEQQKIAEGLKLYGRNWQEIANYVGTGRSRGGVMHHYNNVMKPKKTGIWTPAEKELLLQGMAIHGEKWTEVCKMVPNRTDIQCRDHWTGVLDPTLKKGCPWEDSEVAILEDLARTLTKPNGKPKWSKIAAQLPGRTDSQVKSKYQRLNGEPRNKKLKHTAQGAPQRASTSAAAQQQDEETEDEL